MTRKTLGSCLAAILFLTSASMIFAEQGDDNPTGVAGAFNGQITTGNSYDPYTGNAKRTIDDIVVPGSVGAYPLKWTRYWNSHTSWRDNYQLGASWRFSYSDYKHFKAQTPPMPDGRIVSDAFGVEEWMEESLNAQFYPIQRIVHLADGGQVVLKDTYHYNNNDYPVWPDWYPAQIIDPYGQITTLSWVVYGWKGTTPTAMIKLDRVTEPGGRYLQITWDNTNTHIIRVDAYDGVNSQPTQWVTYHWISGIAAGEVPAPQDVIDIVNYSDGTSAHYTYGDGKYLGPPICSAYQGGRGYWNAPQLLTADDPHVTGPMRQIAYTYSTDSYNQTRVSSENHAVVAGGTLTAGEAVSTVSPARDTPTAVTETRGDGATRSFTYNSVARCSDCPVTGDFERCRSEPMPMDGKLTSFTDFLNHTSNITYETDPDKASAGFITAVTDANGRITKYDRQTNSWGITKITFPDGSSVEQGFYPDANGNAAPYYLGSRTLPHGPNDPVQTISYQRDSNNRIIEKDYPHDPDEPASYETFFYNSFGQVTVHYLTNGSPENFTYDSRGLKTSWRDAAGALTTYTYYTSGPWSDRLKTVTRPANVSGFSAAETYEYDRDANGNAVAGRGLVTKIVHDDPASPGVYGDGSFVTKAYNQYGDVLSETDELGHTTTYSHDDYGRVLTTTTPPQFQGDTQNHTSTISYVPTGQASSYVTTAKLPFATTLPSGKQTTFEYDFNWRKTWVHQAPSTSDVANTRYIYDQYTSTAYGNYTSIGNLLATIDPRGNVTSHHYDIRDREDSTTDPLGHQATVHYNLKGQKDSETHANGLLIEYLQYDGMNRLRHQLVHREQAIQDDTYNTYDASGNLNTHKDEDGNIYNYDYDSMNRLTQLTYPNTKTEVHTYDAAGNVQTYKNRGEAIQTFSYDKRNRQTSFSWSNEPTGQHTTSLTTVFDAVSRKTQIVNDDATINFTYFDDNKLARQEEWVTSASVGDNVHRFVTYGYDPDGNRSSIQYPSGAKFDYHYTQRNQVSDIALDGTLTPAVSYQFDSAGNIIRRALDNGTSTAYTVDQGNRDTTLVHTLTGGPKRFDYAYNEVNDITVVQRDLGQGDKYEYDLTQEIKRFAQNGNVDLTNGTITTPANDTNMTFDGCGNQKSLNGAGTFQVDNLNEYTTYNGAAVANDVEGNVQTYNGWTYTYDAQHRLRQATSTTITTQFYYDGLDRQVARANSAGTGIPNPTPTPLPLVSPLPTITPMPSIPATPTIPPTGVSPTPTPTPKCSPPTITEANGQITMTPNNPNDATIFYTVREETNSYAPTHSGSVPTGITQAYSTPIPIEACKDKAFRAIEYKAGYTDSNEAGLFSKHSNEFGCGGIQGPTSASSSGPSVVFSVWDGDWAILEEYATGNVLVEKYLQGYHGLVKTFQTVAYYYQDELGSTSQIADGTGSIIESYQYDVYGKPRVYNASGVYQANATPVANFLQGGARWMPELGLYDDRHRFMSPDLGRFLQPDPIGFKGDASNLYRYCGNDWANRSDPMGLEENPPPDPTSLPSKEIASTMRIAHDDVPGAILGGVGWSFRNQYRNPFDDMKGFTMGVTPRANSIGNFASPNRLSLSGPHSPTASDRLKHAKAAAKTWSVLAWQLRLPQRAKTQRPF